METELRELIAKKDDIEEEIKHLNHKCESIDKEKSFSKGLVDNEGFPRADIEFGELADYRNSKRRLNELNNDHLALMKEIEAKLYLHHEQIRKDPNFKPVQEVAETKAEQSKPVQVAEIKPAEANFYKEKKSEVHSNKQYVIEYLTPFARLTTVEERSPAEVGGLRSGDLLSEFSSVNVYTPDNIKQIPTVVVENKPLRIVVLREVVEGSPSGPQKVHAISGKNYVKHVVQVKPERWGGRGLLGCKIDPIQ